jgi:hypothetical protein
MWGAHAPSRASDCAVAVTNFSFFPPFCADLMRLRQMERALQVVEIAAR